MSRLSPRSALQPLSRLTAPCLGSRLGQLYNPSVALRRHVSALASVGFAIPQSAPLTCLGSRLGRLYNPSVALRRQLPLHKGAFCTPASSAPLHMGAYKPSLCMQTLRVLLCKTHLPLHRGGRTGGPRKRWEDCFLVYANPPSNALRLTPPL